MIGDDEILFDAFTPINVFTGALARYRGYNLGTMLLIGATLEVAEQAFVHYFGHHLPDTGPREQPRNMAMGLLATVFGWGLADITLRGGFTRVRP